MKLKNTLGALSLAAALSLVGCGGGGSNNILPIKNLSDDGGNDKDQGNNNKGISDLANSQANQALVDNITDDVIVAGYTALQTESEELTTALDKLAANTTQANLEAAQKQWRDTRVPWESGEGHIFGPVDSLGVDPAVDSWPVDKAELDGSLSGWNIGDSVDGFPDEQKGFHAIEYVLFGDGTTTNTRPVGSLTAKQLAYVAALGASMEGEMKTLNDAWRVSFDGDAPYTDTFKGLSVAASTEELMGGLIGIVDEVGVGKMGDPFNDQDTTLVESQFSWNSTTDFMNNIISVRNVWKTGMDELIAKIDADTAAAITTQIDDAIAKIIAISDPDGDGQIDVNDKNVAFRNQITNPAGRVLIQDAITALAELQASLESIQ